MNQHTIENWAALSDYDFKTATAMLKTRRYLYVVFTCQQSLEKLLKALYVKETGQTPPYIHNLTRLAEALSIWTTLTDAQRELLRELNLYYLESRYTEELQKISRKLTRARCQEFYAQTKDMRKWLKTLI